MTVRYRNACAAVFLLLLSAAAQAAEPAVPDPLPKLSADECAVWARELSFAQSVADHDAAAFAAHLHDGAVFGAKSAQPQRGREAVAQGWAGIVAGKRMKLSWYPTMVAIGGEPGIAYSSGPALYESLAPEAKQRFSLGAFQSVWHKGADGVWRVLFDDGVQPVRATEAQVAAFREGRRQACPQG
ncbi:DUF4440 domain-containing protein [Luteimonas sp. SX5]|uniref:DUF4440 domain-containing protein n=1 Tax=Luteimonas galliterrae TaxID=2940486 RepID=A0ABT0MHF1_9GAMM|nr:DUF4440 domain-containing protein [Luteimonas galliterrae]MCL1634293.1 DUF4440 domain-containing protein [Luteimonas galliterrae]